MFSMWVQLQLGPESDNSAAAHCVSAALIIHSIMTSAWLSVLLPKCSAGCTPHFCSCEASGRQPGRETSSECQLQHRKEEEESVGRSARTSDSPGGGGYHICVTVNTSWCVQEQNLPGSHPCSVISLSSWNKISSFLLHSDYPWKN